VSIGIAGHLDPFALAVPLVPELSGRLDKLHAPTSREGDEWPRPVRPNLTVCMHVPSVGKDVTGDTWFLTEP
jgi:hypothetical protein